jgi:hypothetical protein
MATMKKLSGIERCRVKKKPKKIDLIVRGVCVYWVIFVSISWITYWVMGSIPDTLVQFGLGGGAVELLVSGLIEVMRDVVQRRMDHGEIDE